MARCNELCTKDATGTCALCEAPAERDRFTRFWFKGGWFIDGIRVLRQWWYPVPHTEVRHQDVVRAAHKQYSETLNKTMLALLGVAFFCLLATIGSPDKLLLVADSMIKVPYADVPISMVAGLVGVAPFLLIALVIYLHVFYGYWLECERERQYINQRLIPPIESIPALFTFPDVIPRTLTGFVFYWLVPLVLVAITIKAWALPARGLHLTYISGVVTFVLVVLQFRRRSDKQPKWWNALGCTILILIIGLMALATCKPHWFQRRLHLFGAELAKALLVEIDMRRASAGLANLQQANLFWAKLQEADLSQANLQAANLRDADLSGAKLWGADLTEAEYLTQDQVNTACVDEDTKLPEGLTKPPPCPNAPPPQ